METRTAHKRAVKKIKCKITSVGESIEKLETAYIISVNVKR